MFVQSRIQRVQRHNHHNNRQRHQPTATAVQIWPHRARRSTGQVIRWADSLHSIGSDRQLLEWGELLKILPGSRHASRTTKNSPIRFLRLTTRSRNCLKRSSCFGKSISCLLISNLNQSGLSHLIIRQSSFTNKKDKKSGAINQAQNEKFSALTSRLKSDLSLFYTLWARIIQAISNELSNRLISFSSKFLSFQWHTVVQLNVLFDEIIHTTAECYLLHEALNCRSSGRVEPKMRPSANLNAIKFAPSESGGHYSFDENYLNAASSSQPNRDQHRRCLMTDAHNPMGPCGELHCYRQRGASTRSPLVAQLSPADYFAQTNQVLRHQQPKSCAGFGHTQGPAHDYVPTHSAPSQMAFDFVQMPSRHHRPELVSLCQHHQLPPASSSSIQHCWHDQGLHYYWLAQLKQPERVDLVANLNQRRMSVSSPVLFVGGEQFEQNSAHCNYHHARNQYAGVTLLNSPPSRTFHPISNNTSSDGRSRDTCNELAAACPVGRSSLQLRKISAKNTVPHYHRHQHFHSTRDAPQFGQRADSLVQNHYNSNSLVKEPQRKLSSVIISDSELCRQSSQLQAQLSNCTLRDKSLSTSSVSSSLSSLGATNNQIKLARSNLTNAHQPALSAFKFPQAPPLRRLVHPLDGLRLHRQGSSTTSEVSFSQHPGQGSQSSQQESNLSKLRQQANLNGRERPSRFSTQTEPPDDSQQQVVSGPQETEPTNGEKGQSSSLQIQKQGASGRGIKLAASGKSRSLMHSPIGLAAAATLGKVSLAGAKRRLGFKQNRGLNSLSVHRSEEIFPSELNSNCSHCNQFNQFMGINTTADVSCSLNETSLELGYNYQVCSPRQLQSKWLSRFSSESPDPKVCFVDGLGLGQVVSRQALVSPYLGDIQISLSDRRGMLEVEVIRVRQLQAQPRAKRPPAFYVKVYLMKDKKCLAKVKTSKINHTLNPLFQQLFIFRENYKHCVLQIIVWANHGKNDRKLLKGLVQIQLDELDISNVVLGWYRLFNASSMVANQLVASSSKSLRQTSTPTKLAYTG